MKTNILTLQNFYRRNYAFLFTFFLFILSYFPIIVWMFDRWFARDSYYSHGILIPFVSIYLIWQKRHDILQIPIRNSKKGILLIITGCFIYFMASAFRVYFLSGISMLVTIWGIILYFFGTQLTKKIWFPLFLLIFMIPIPLVFITNISFRMKLAAAEIATSLLNHIGIDAIREGSYIYMKHAYVVVDDVCSGLRSLIALTALGSLFAYYNKCSVFKKWIIFLSTIPIAIITNVFRISFLSFVSEVWGPEKTIGFIHDASGFLVFFLAFVLLTAIGRLLE